MNLYSDRASLCYILIEKQCLYVNGASPTVCLYANGAAQCYILMEQLSVYIPMEHQSIYMLI